MAKEVEVSGNRAGVGVFAAAPHPTKRLTKTTDVTGYILKAVIAKRAVANLAKAFLLVAILTNCTPLCRTACGPLFTMVAKNLPEINYLSAQLVRPMFAKAKRVSHGLHVSSPWDLLPQNIIAPVERRGRSRKVG